MSIKSKFIIILVLVGLVSVLFAAYMLGIYQKSHYQVKILKASIGDLYAIRKYRSDIYLQISQSVDFLLSGKDEDEDGYVRFKENSIRSYEQWVKAIQKSLELGEDKSVEMARADLLKKRFDQASAYIDQAFEAAEFGDNERAYELIENNVEDWVNYDLSEEVDGALAAEVGEVNEAYDKVLIWLGSMPWATEQTLREVRRARYAMNDALAADRILSSMSVQHKDFMDYLFSGDESELREFEEYELVTQIALRDWANSISSREELSGLEKRQWLQTISEIEKIYQKLVKQSQKAFAMKVAGRNKELLEFLDKELQPLFHALIVEKISDEIDKARDNIDESSKRLVDITYYAGISGILFMTSGSLLVVIMMFLVLRGIIQSLSRLQVGTEIIGSGRFDHRIGLETRDELGKLSASFDMMCERLERMRNEIIAAKQYTDNILRSMKDTLLVVSPDGIIQTVNESTCRLLQYREAELIGQPVDRIITDGFDAGNGLPANGYPFHVEKNYRLKDGRQIPVSFSSSILQDESGNPLGIVCVAQDITERKQAEEELRSSERKYRRLSTEFHALLDAIPDSLTLIDPELNILWANKGAEQLIGLQPEALLSGKACYQVRQGYTSASKECPILKSFTTGREAQNHQLTPGGKNYEVRAFPIKDDAGAVTSVIEVVVDITEKMKLQADATQAAHLASLGELAAGVAHEINNPINSIINYAQILQDDSEQGSPSVDIINRILNDGDRIATIVRSLLSFARVSSEEKLPTGIDDILETALALTRTQLRKEGINLKVSCSETLPSVRVNPQQIEQVFLNIINNSRYALNRKYATANEDKILDITAGMISGNAEPRLRVTFTDHGTGIAADVLDQVLHPFFSTKPMGVGTGLGLSISHGIVSDHGGKIKIDSAEGQFTRVVIDLPVHLPAGETESEVV